MFQPQSSNTRCVWAILGSSMALKNTPGTQNISLPATLIQESYFMSPASMDLTRERMTLPSLPIFRSLVSHATYRPGEPCIIDNDTGKTASHAQLVTDVASLIDVLNSSSHSDSQDTEPPYICVLAPPSYEFAVAFLAVAGALGVIVPLSMPTLTKSDPD